MLHRMNHTLAPEPHQNIGTRIQYPYRYGHQDSECTWELLTSALQPASSCTGWRHTALPCDLQQALDTHMLASLLIHFRVTSNIEGCPAVTALRTSLVHKAIGKLASLLTCSTPQATSGNVRHACFCTPAWRRRVWLLTRAGRNLLCIP